MMQGQWMKKANWGLMGMLVLITHGAGIDKFLGVIIQSGQPEPALEDLFVLLNPWVAGE